GQFESNNVFTFTNAGNFDCRPRITLFGGTTGAGVKGGPSIQNQSVPGGPFIYYSSYGLPECSQLSPYTKWQINLDTYYRTATIQGPGSQSTVGAQSNGAQCGSLTTLQVASTAGFDIGTPLG